MLDSLPLQFPEEFCLVKSDKCLLVLRGNPLSVSGAEKLLINVFVQDHFFPDGIDVNELHNLEPMIDWFFDLIASFSYSV